MSLPVLGRAARAARDWPVSSQQVARRNAMREANVCARRRAEREEIEEFVRAAAGPRRTHAKVRRTEG